MKHVIGIDPSLTATGVAWPDGTTEVISWPGRGVERLANVAWWVENLPYDNRWPDQVRRHDMLVIVEGYAHGRANQAHQMGELGGVLRYALHVERIPFFDVPPACVKKYATGKGNANKDLVRDAARDRLGPLAPGISSDECDALWLRQIGLAIVDTPAAVKVPQTHLAALDKLDLVKALYGGEAA